MRKRKFWGWGYEDELLSDEEENNIDKRIANTFNLDSVDRIKIPDIKSIDLPKRSPLYPFRYPIISKFGYLIK